MSHDEATQARFAATAARLAAVGEARIDETRERLRRFLEPRGDERTLDVGTGTGTLALALAPLVGEVVGIDPVPEMLAYARRAASDLEHVSFVEGDALNLGFEAESFDLVATSRTIHHVAWPDIAMGELMRVCRTHGHLLVVDQIANNDPLEALAQNRIEHLRDPSHARLLSDQDFRGLFDAQGLVLRRSELEQDQADLGDYLDLAGCEGDARAEVYAEVERLFSIEQAEGIGLRRSERGYAIVLTVAWYVLEKVPGPVPTVAA